MLRLKAAVLMPPLAVPTRDVISERSANGVSLLAAPTAVRALELVVRHVVAQRLQLIRQRQEAGHARTLARLLRPVDRRRLDDGLGLDDRLGLALDDALLDDGLGLGRGLLAHDGRRRRRRASRSSTETREALRHFLDRGRDRSAAPATPRTASASTSAATSEPRASFLKLRIVLEPRGPRQLVDSIQCDCARSTCCALSFSRPSRAVPRTPSAARPATIDHNPPPSTSP